MLDIALATLAYSCAATAMLADPLDLDRITALRVAGAQEV